MELKEIINGMIAETGRPMSAEDIYKSMKDNGGEIQIEEIKLALKELSRDGRVIITRRGKAALPEQLGLIYGRIQGNGRGFGFFIPADGSGDLFITAEDMNGALHGDTVWVRKLTGSPRGRKDRGAVEMIARRAGGRVIGTFEADNEYGGYVVPDDSRGGRGCAHTLFPYQRRKPRRQGGSRNNPVSRGKAAHAGQDSRSTGHAGG